MKKLLIIMLFCLCTPLLYGQGQIYGGRVLSDIDGSPLPGVTVLEKGTVNGTITGTDGSFSIAVRGTSPVFVFSMIGMLDVELPATDGMTVTMKEDVMMIDAVIMTAYGSSRKASYTGSAAVVDRRQIENMQVSSVSQLLQGAGTGLQVMDANGQPGSDATIRIRGISSLTGSNDPLYVVDGAPYGGYVNAINPNDIESITVLKDAQATALYGSRAAAGVILITTKSGKRGKPEFSFSSNFGTSQLAVPMHEVLNPNQIHEMTWEALYNGYLANGSNDYSARQDATDNLKSYLNVRAYGSDKPVSTDGKLVEGLDYQWPGNSWKDSLFKNRLRQDYNASVNGSKEDLNYFMSLGYLSDKGSLTVSEFERFSGRLSLSTKITEWFEMGMSTAFSHSHTDSPDQSRVMRFVREVPDIYPIYEWDEEQGDYKKDESGNRILDFGSYRPSAAWPKANPLAEAKYDQRYWENEQLSSRINAGIYLPLDLKFTTTFAVDYSIASGYYYYSDTYGWAADEGGQSTRDRNRFLTYTLSNLLTWDKAFGSHHINLLAGHEAYSNKSNYLSGQKKGFPISGMYELGGAAVIVATGSSEDNVRMESWLARAEYDYSDRYYFSASLRRDASSRFRKDNRWGNFWSVGASWRISNEDFMKGVGWLDNLKLKASYGTVGNDRIGLYPTHGTYNSGWNDLGHPGYVVGALSAPNLRWESTNSLNIGLDATFFGRIDLSVEWFDRTTYDMLSYRDLPPSGGIPSVADNIGDMRNRGVELQLRSVNILRKDFRWETDINLSHYRNKILKLPAGEKVQGYHIWREGGSIYDFYLPEWAGVDPVTGEGYFWQDVYDRDAEGNLLADDKGEYIVVGRLKTSNYGNATRYLKDSSLPDLYGGITNTFYYKNFDLSLFFYFSVGGKVVDTNYASLMQAGAGANGLNWSVDILDRWTPENTGASVPKVTSETNYWSSGSTRFLYDASYLRLRNVTLGYKLPERIISKAGLKSVRIYLKGDNLFTLTKHKGLDPGMYLNGVTSNGLSSMMTFSGGVDIRF